MQLGWKVLLAVAMECRETRGRGLDQKDSSVEPERCPRGSTSVPGCTMLILDVPLAALWSHSQDGRTTMTRRTLTLFTACVWLGAALLRPVPCGYARELSGAQRARYRDLVFRAERGRLAHRGDPFLPRIRGRRLPLLPGDDLWAGPGPQAALLSAQSSAFAGRGDPRLRRVGKGSSPVQQRTRG